MSMNEAARLAERRAESKRIGGQMNAPVEWRITPGLVPYPEALAAMEARVDAIRRGEAGPSIWLLEHPPLYSAGTSAAPDELLDPERFPVFTAGRGGRYTYHGPGQRIAYVMLDLGPWGHDLRGHVRRLEEWVIRSLATFGVEAERRADRIGVWVRRGDRPEAKIAAIGVRVRRWVTFHGLALNVAPDLEHFSGIVPCGIGAYPVTSLADLDVDVTMDEVDAALRASFASVFAR